MLTEGPQPGEKRHTMNRLTIFGSLLGAVALASMGCGDNSAVCGEGTYEDNNVCLPDGTVTCEQGTVMNPEGDCIVDPTVCADGTVFIEGECIPEDDTLTADFEAAAEPNDGTEENDGVAGTILLEDGDIVSVHGCITPYRDVDGNDNLDIDYDMWEITVNEPTIVEVTADGVHGLSAGFIWIGRSDETQPLIDNAWTRFGISLSSDTSNRQVYLPIAGTYGLMMSDSRSIFLPDGGAGSNEETCYYSSISRLAVPTATPIAADVQVNNVISGAPLFYSYNPVEGDFLDVQHSIASAAAAPSIVTLNSEDFYRYGEPASAMGGLRDSDELILVVEPVYNYAQAPVDFTLRVHPYATGALPIDGTSEDGVSTVSDAPTWFALDEITFLWFDVGADEVVHFDMDFSSGDGCKGPCPFDLNLAFVGSDLPVTGDILDPFQWTFVSINTFADFYFGQNYVDSFTGWVRFPEAGRYYAAFFPPDLAAGETFTVTSTVNRVVPANASINTPIDDAPFSDLGATWHDFDGGSSIWVGLDASATAPWGDDVSVDFFDPALIGVYELDFGPSFFRDIASDGSDADVNGRIWFGQPNDFFVMVRDFNDELATAASTYDLSVHDRDFTDLGTVTLTTPLTRLGEISGTNSFADGVAPFGTLYFVRSTPGLLLTITADPVNDEDVTIDNLNRNEGILEQEDPGFDGDTEVMTVLVPADGYVALRISDWDSDDHLFDLGIVATDPCAGGMILPQTPDGTLFGLVGDEAFSSPQTTPFPFPYFGTNVTSYWVSANGFLSFGPNVNNAFFGNTAIPNAANPNGIIAPFWDDVENVQLCKIETATTVTIRWLFGNRYNLPAQTTDFEATLHSDGTIDFAYGDDQVPNGSTATIGAENVTGTQAIQFGFNTANQAIDRSFNTSP